MSGLSDLGDILAGIDVRQRDGDYVYATIPVGDPLPDVPVAAMVSEVEAVTLVLERDVADAIGLAWEFEAAWLTLTAHTSLDAVGVTAAVSTALAMRGIPCNVLAGAFHDHLLVPVDAVDLAVEAVRDLRLEPDRAG